LDYAGLLPVVKWLIKKLMDSRDTRSVLNRKQGLLNFRLRQTDKNSQSEGVFAANDSTLRGDTSYLKSVIFNGKPKRAFKANQRSKISFQDPKRVHIALREFNDMSANDAFKKMLSNIQANREEEEQNRELNRRKQTLAMKKAGGALGGALAKGLGSKLAGLTKSKAMTIENEGDGFMAGLDMEEANDDDVIANVERMLKGGAEQDKAMKADRKIGSKGLDMNDGAAAPSGGLSGLKALAQLAKMPKKKKKKEKAAAKAA